MHKSNQLPQLTWTVGRIVAASVLALFLSCIGLKGQEGSLTCAVETVRSTSAEVFVSVVVVGLDSERPWIPLGVVLLTWDPAHLEFESASVVGESGWPVLTAPLKEAPGILLGVQCGVLCPAEIRPRHEQPFLTVKFKVLTPFPTTRIEILPDAVLANSPPAETHIKVNDGSFTAVRPMLDHGGICLQLFRRGDANADGVLRLDDALAALQFLFREGSLLCLDFADANDDGKVNVSDPVWVLTYLFRGGPTPPPPFASPGLDPTGDKLACLGLPDC